MLTVVIETYCVHNIVNTKPIYLNEHYLFRNKLCSIFQHECQTRATQVQQEWDIKKVWFFEWKVEHSWFFKLKVIWLNEIDYYSTSF